MMPFAQRYGPWAVVAGASDGTGREFARAIAARGVSCALIARREAPLVELAEEIRSQYGVECKTMAVDLATQGAFDTITAATRGLEIGLYVNNAGADPYGSRFLDEEIGAWLDLTQRNVATMLKCCHHFAAPMRERRRGGLLLVNSGACYGGASFMAVYSATKAFTLCFAEGLWAELHGHGVDVLTLALGKTDTPAYRALLARKGMPIPERMASPAEVANVGLAQLPNGPVYNWGQSNDVAGYAPTSPNARRARIETIDRHSSNTFGDT
jgi:uncharacterized protein